MIEHAGSVEQLLDLELEAGAAREAEPQAAAGDAAERLASRSSVRRLIARASFSQYAGTRHEHVRRDLGQQIEHVGRRREVRLPAERVAEAQLAEAEDVAHRQPQQIAIALLEQRRVAHEPVGAVAADVAVRERHALGVARGAARVEHLVLAGGTLGILIPPSVMAIVYAVVAQQSLGELLVGSIFPGFLLSGLYIAADPDPLLHQPEPWSRITAGRARQYAGKIQTAEEHHRAAPADRAGSRRDLRRHCDTGRGGGHRHLRRAVRVRAASPAQLVGRAGGRDRDAESDCDGDVDFLRRNHVRRILHREGRANVCGEHHPRHRIAAIRHFDADDADPIRARHVHRLGRYPLLLTVPIFLPIMKSLEWGGLFGLPGVRAEDVPLWYGVIFHGQYANGISVAAVRLFVFYLKSVAPPEITMATIFRAAVQFMALQWLGVGLSHCVSVDRRLVTKRSVLAVDGFQRGE